MWPEELWWIGWAVDGHLHAFPRLDRVDISDVPIHFKPKVLTDCFPRTEESLIITSRWMEHFTAHSSH